MICNVLMLSSCSSLAHCTSFSALLSVPSFAWQCLTPWLLICLAPGPTLSLCVFSICDHKGVSIGIDRSIDRYGCIDSIDSSAVSTVIDSYRQLSTVSTVREHRVTGTQYRQLSTVSTVSTVRQFDSIDRVSTVSTVVRQYRQYRQPGLWWCACCPSAPARWGDRVTQLRFSLVNCFAFLTSKRH